MSLREIGTVGDHVGRHWIWLHCSCGHAKCFDPEDLAQWLGASYPNRKLVDRARCAKCGKPAHGMTLEPLNAYGYARTAQR